MVGARTEALHVLHMRELKKERWGGEKVEGRATERVAEGGRRNRHHGKSRWEKGKK